LHFTLADLVTDITQNAAESGAALVELTISETERAGDASAAGTAGKVGKEFRFTVKDNGKGMSAEDLKRAQDPFVTDGVKHPGRKIGLGVPFLIQTAEMSGGGWTMDSVPGAGTEVSAWFDTANVDTPPAGDVPGMFRTVLLFPGPAELVIHRLREGGGGALDYEVRKTELSEALGGLEDTQSLILLDRYLRSLEEDEE
jgi:hypothetical protein